MRITLCTPAVHAELLALFDGHPELCFQNSGYEYLPPAVLEEKAPQIARISEILKEHVVGFVKFFNFRMSARDGVVLRFDYDWGATGGMHFTGVGYLPLDHLRDGFPENASQS